LNGALPTHTVGNLPRSLGSPSPSPASNKRPADHKQTALRTTNMLPPQSESREARVMVDA
jgi:hypothetical protein